jgi:hypothetical protein
LKQNNVVVSCFQRERELVIYSNEGLARQAPTRKLRFGLERNGFSLQTWRLYMRKNQVLANS